MLRPERSPCSQTTRLERRRPLGKQRSCLPRHLSSCRCSSWPRTIRSRSSSRSGISPASTSSPRPRPRWPSSCGPGRCSSRSSRSSLSMGGLSEPPSAGSPDCTDRVREELQPDRQQQVHVPHPQGRAPAAGPAGGRGAVRRPRPVGEHRGRQARLEEGDRPDPRGRDDRDLRGSTSLMALRKYKPTSPGRRFMTVSTFDEVTKTEPEKSLVAPLKKKGGRNSYGRITTRHQGGGHKRRYRVIDFKRTKDGVPAKVAAIEYDPNRSARIALLHYADGA